MTATQASHTGMIAQRIADIGIVPVIAIDEESQAARLAETLVDAGRWQTIHDNAPKAVEAVGRLREQNR